MKSAIIAVLLALLATGAVGCKKSPTTPPPAGPPASGTDSTATPEPTPAAAELTDEQLTALMDELAGFMETMATAVEGTGTDCGAMATRIDEVTGDHADLLTRVRRFDDPAVEDRADAYMQSHGDRINGAAKRLKSAARSCQDDDGVRAALERVGS